MRYQLRQVISAIFIFILIISGFTIYIAPATSKLLNSNQNLIGKKSEFDYHEGPNVLRNLNQIDGYFTENRGQAGNESVRYYIQGKGVWFLDNGVVFEIKDSIESRESRESRESGSPELWKFRRNFQCEATWRSKLPQSELLPFDEYNGIGTLEPKRCVVIKLNFEDSNKIVPKGIGLLPHRSNFFYGNDSNKWFANVPNYQEIIYKNLYEKIDLRYYSSPKGLKYEFIVHPGGNPNNIKLRYYGLQALSIDSSGNLRIQTQLGDIVDSELYIYQSIDEIQNKLKGKFIILDSKTYGFKIISKYDNEKELVIDPLLYSTYIGGTGYEIGNGISIDTNGDAYVTGFTDGPDFPNTTGAYDNSHNIDSDAFILKLNHNGSTLLYSTFIGGSNYDEALDINVDINGNVYITGVTNSADFPYTSGAYNTTHNGGSDSFVVKLNPGGNGISDLKYSTFLGGTLWDLAQSITIDTNGRVYLTGRTFSSDFPTTANAYDETQNGDYDVFMVKLNPAGNNANDLIYSTFIGGLDFEVGYGIAIDSSGVTYIAGQAGTSFPTTTGAFSSIYNGSYDGFIVKLNPAGTGLNDLVYSTYIGGSNIDEARSIAIDTNLDAYVTGVTNSNDFPTSSNACDNSYNQGNDIFVLKLTLGGNGINDLQYSTYIGGNNNDWGWDIAADIFGHAYITGYTYSNNFPTSPSTAYDTSYNGKEDVVVMKLGPNGSTLDFSTYIGGIDNDLSYSIAIDSKNNMYVTGYTTSAAFPTTQDVYDPSYNFGYDCFILKLEINHLPKVIDLNVSTRLAFRTNTIFIYSNGTDVEDLEPELIPTFEYKDPNHITWQNESLGTPAYIKNRWQVSLQLEKSAPIGYYDFRVRYTDTGLLHGNWRYLYDGLKVQNNLPIIVDLTISVDKAFQNESLFVWVNGNDIEDPEQNLSVQVEYRASSEIKWNNTNLIGDEPSYIGDKWEIKCSIPFGTPFGYYDFRANITDSDGNYTDWLPLYNVLLISNKNPEFVDVGLSKSKIYRNESVLLYSNCSDYETPESNLNYQAEYKHKNDSKWLSLPNVYSGDHWVSEFTPEIDSKLGIYNFRVKFEDNVNESTGWQYIEESLEVLNNAPMISYALDDIKIGMRPEILTLTQFEIDVEDTNENLIWSVDETKSYDCLNSVKIIDTMNDLIEIVPLISVNDEIDIELTLTDKDGGFDTRSNITIHVDSRVTEYTPKVTLLSPPDGSIVNTLTPKLEWNLDYDGDELVTYTVFIDENPKPKAEIISELTMTSYTLETNLEDGKTYYWYVVPSWGITLSEPFNFTVDLDFNIVHNVNLISERSYISLKQGESVSINLTVKNKGNVKDSFKIEYSAIKFAPALSINKPILQLDKETAGKVQLSINASKNFETGEYIIYVKAISLGNNSRTDDVNITVEILSRFFIPSYDVALEVVPTSIEIEQTKSKNVTLIIENIGNVADEYYIVSSSLTFKPDVVQIMEVLVFIKPGFSVRVNVTITIPEDMEATLHTIIFKAKSYRTIDDAELTVNVFDKGDITEPSDENKVEKEDDTILFIGIGIVVIIIIVVLIILIIFIHKKKEEEYLHSIKKEVEEEEETKLKSMKKPFTITQNLPKAQPIELVSTVKKPPQLEPTVIDKRDLQK